MKQKKSITNTTNSIWTRKNTVFYVCVRMKTKRMCTLCALFVFREKEMHRERSPLVVEWFLAVCLVGRAWNKSLLVCVLAENNRREKNAIELFYLSLHQNWDEASCDAVQMKKSVCFFNLRFTFQLSDDINVDWKMNINSQYIKWENVLNWFQSFIDSFQLS